MPSRSYRTARIPSPPLRLVRGGRDDSPPAPDRELTDRMREAALGYYSRAIAELAEAREQLRAAHECGDEPAARRALRLVWSANLKADRYHDELLALFKPTTA